MKKDTGWKRFFSDGRRYADLINGLGCGGRQMITEKDLQELCCTAVRESGTGRYPCTG